MRKRGKAPFDPRTFLAKVGEGKTISKYRKDQIVFSQGQIADAVFYIRQGKVKLTVVSEQGKEAVVAILGPGDFFGEGCLNGHPLRIATTRAMDECVITRLEKAAMIATLHNETDFSELFMSYLLARNSRIEEDLIDQLFNSSEKRLARLLLLLANFGKEGQAGADRGKVQSGNAGGDDRHDPIARELFHEQIPQIGFYRIQRKTGSPQFLVERDFVRQARDRNEGCPLVGVARTRRAARHRHSRLRGRAPKGGSRASSCAVHIGGDARPRPCVQA